MRGGLGLLGGGLTTLGVVLPLSIEEALPAQASLAGGAFKLSQGSGQIPPNPNGQKPPQGVFGGRVFVELKV